MAGITPLKETWAQGEDFLHTDQNDVAKAINRLGVVIEASSAPGGTATVNGNIPDDAKGVRVLRMIGPGGPGGGGQYNGAANTNRTGGGGGAGGNVVTERFYPRSAFGGGTTFSAVCPAPALGGDARSTTGVGNNGAAPGNAVLTIGTLLVTASGGGPGLGGGTANNGGLTGALGDLFGTPGAAGTTNAVPVTPTPSPTVTVGAKTYGGGAGAGGGSGISSSGVTGPTAGTGGSAPNGAAGGTPGTSAGAVPSSPGAVISMEPGPGAGGGALNNDANVRKGADAVGYGAGGGGGAGSGGSGGVPSGPGGKGGPAYIAFMWVY